MTLKTVLLLDNFTDPALPGWNVLDNGATTWPAELGVDAGPPQFGTGETESCWRRNVSTSPDGLKITMTRGGAGWESGRMFYEGSFKPQSGQLLRFEFAATLPKNDGRYNGYWPAGWMMPSVHRVARGFWPFAGEIDVLEAIGGKSGSSQALHIGHWGDNLYAKPINGKDMWSEPTGIGTGLAGIDPWDGQKHIYAWEWDRSLGAGKDELRYSVDGTVTLAIPAVWFPKLVWEAFEFHNGFYPIFNLAIDGSFPEAVNSRSTAATQPGGVFAVHYCEISSFGEPAPSGEDEPDLPPIDPTPDFPEIPEPGDNDITINVVEGKPVSISNLSQVETLGALVLTLEKYKQSI